MDIKRAEKNLPPRKPQPPSQGRNQDEGESVEAEKRKILREAEAITRGWAGRRREIEVAAKAVAEGDFKRIYLVGSGSSYHSSLAAQAFLARVMPLATTVIQASEFIDWTPPRFTEKTLIIASTLPWGDEELLEATRTAKERGGEVLTIGSNTDDPLRKLALNSIARGGAELSPRGVFTDRLMALYLLSSRLAEEFNICPRTTLRSFEGALLDYPKATARLTRSLEIETQHLDRFTGFRFFTLLGRGPNYATSLEGALMLGGAGGVFAEGFEALEFSEGPSRVLGAETATIIFNPKGSVSRSLTDLAGRLHRFGVPLLLISQSHGVEGDASQPQITIPPNFPELLTPLLFIVPVRLLAALIAGGRGV